MVANTLAAVSPEEQFKLEGFFVARRLFSTAEVKTIRGAFMAAAEGGPVPGLSEVLRGAAASDPLTRYPRMMKPHRHADLPLGPLTRRCMLDKRLERLLRRFAGKEVWAVNSMFYFKPPGARGQELHQDNFYLRAKPGTCLAAWIAMDDCDAENGAMQVVPGSQSMETVCPEQADSGRSFTTHWVRPPSHLQPVLMEMQAGDVLFFNGQLIHGSGPNTSRDRFRRALIFHYIPAGSIELAKYYDAIDFSGRPVSDIHTASGGGPCGDEFEAQGPH